MRVFIEGGWYGAEEFAEEVLKSLNFVHDNNGVAPEQEAIKFRRHLARVVIDELTRMALKE